MTLHKLFQAHLKRADVMFHKSYKGETRKQKVTSAQGEGARVVFSGITVEIAVTSA